MSTWCLVLDISSSGTTILRLPIVIMIIISYVHDLFDLHACLSSQGEFNTQQGIDFAWVSCWLVNITQLNNSGRSIFFSPRKIGLTGEHLDKHVACETSDRRFVFIAQARAKAFIVTCVNWVTNLAGFFYQCNLWLDEQWIIQDKDDTDYASHRMRG